MKVALISVLLIANLFFSASSIASEKFSLSARVGQQVTKAFELYELGNIDKTLAVIEKIRPRSAFDKAYIKRFQGNLYWEKGDEKRALQSLHIAVNEHALSDHEQSQSERMLADLYLNQKQTDNAIKLYKTLIQKVPSEDLYKHLALAYYQKKSWNNLVDATSNGIKLSAEFNQSIHILQLSALFELKDYKKANKTLVKLTEHDAKTKRWWMQLASTYQILKQDKKALATYEQAYQLGFLENKSEIKRLANFRASLGAPYQAALLLESSINSGKLAADSKNYQQLAQFWQVAREYDKAQQYWGRSADLNGDAQNYFTQAQLLQLLGRHEQMLTVLASIKADDQALQGKVAITQVQGLFALKKYQQAKQIAEQLIDNPDNKDRALQWVKLLESREADAQQFAI
ncbi:hypothetical protein GCM10007916_20580 [Psychromonas marina]|uniref:Tetratricopeptide repeat protein n=1 Tax=Psychromonas marina TaxID=88364 RepID=A0ABQ6E1T3_9GAMM|nr:tetratricopeptide repeat protein [Psychromonas marina]GLS90991.1 hypothetical protein GCM10007916_20580 [Psychromonas marina]